MTATTECVQTVTPEELHCLHSEGQDIDLIDVRTPVEFREVHVPFARNVPLDRLDAKEIAASRNGAEKPLYVICHSGKRAQEASDRLIAAGCRNIVNVLGGTLACVDADLPVVRGKKAVSLERQVRMIAGMMCIVGVAGCYFSPWFLVLPGMVGVGMLHAGITDSCLMGIMLSGMPWNQVKQEKKPACAC
jgi:rhodanese-related sulfurtransferase